MDYSKVAKRQEPPVPLVAEHVAGSGGQVEPEPGNSGPRCAVCGSEIDETPIFVNGLFCCQRCGVTLRIAFAGIVEVLHREHQRPRERILAELIERLNLNDFDTVDAFRPRTNLGESV